MKVQLFNIAAAAVALLAAMPGVQSVEETGIVQKSLRGIADSAADVAYKEYGDIFTEGAMQDTCNESCTEDHDCIHGGGFVSCNKCGQGHGTQFFQKCYKEEPPAPVPTPPAPASGGQCGKKCTSDHHCEVGGFNPCLRCNKVHGTLGWKTCMPKTEGEE